MNISINLSAVSNLGCVRSNNEDMALITGTILRDNEYSARFKINDSSRFTAIVADGMGGYGGGEIASEMAIRAFDQFILNLPPDLDNIQILREINDWFDSTHNLICAEQTKPGLANMGCTFTGIFSYQGHLYMLNSGDSRVYRLRGDILKQLSTDHSERERLKNPDIPSNLIYNALGVPNAFIDKTLLDSDFPPCDGDIYIICSDGLSDMCPDSTIEQITSQFGHAAAKPLLEAALNAGGRDNCTIITLQIKIEEQILQPEPSQEQLPSTQPISEPEPQAEPLALQDQQPEIAFNIDDYPSPEHFDNAPADQEPQTVATPPSIDPELVIGSQPEQEPQPQPEQEPTFEPTEDQSLDVQHKPNSPSWRSVFDSAGKKISEILGQSKKKS